MPGEMQWKNRLRMIEIQEWLEFAATIKHSGADKQSIRKTSRLEWSLLVFLGDGKNGSFLVRS